MFPYPAPPPMHPAVAAYLAQMFPQHFGQLGGAYHTPTGYGAPPPPSDVPNPITIHNPVHWIGPHAGGY